MTATNFQTLLAEGVARSFYAMSGGDPADFTSDPDAGDHQLAFDILRMPVPWVDCPTCNGHQRIRCPGPSGGGAHTQKERDALGLRKGIDYCYGMNMGHTCPACAGTGKATVAQLLAWGSAVAQTDPEDWIEFGDQRSAVDGYRNRILGVQP